MKGRRRPPLRVCPLQMVLPRAPVPTALALASPATCICVCIAPSLIAAIAFCVHTPRPLQMASPHALPHAHRADRLIKKKTQGKRNLPDNEAVTKWRIIETLERATPEEIVEFAFALCAP